MKVRTIPAAREDARRAGDRLDREQRGFGARFAALFRGAVAAIRADPRLYSPTEDGPEGVETREFFIKVFEYRVVYAVWNNEAVIVAVIHAARPPGLWLPRLGDVTTPEDSP